MSLIRVCLVLALAAPGCSHRSKTPDADPRPSRSKRDKHNKDDATPNGPQCAHSLAPEIRIDLPVEEHTFGNCDFRVGGRTEITSQAQYEQLVHCADPSRLPGFNFTKVRLVVTRAGAPSQMIGATREADGRILVHVVRPGICSGVDWGDATHVAVIPNDGSAFEVDVCAEPSTCGPGPMPA